ncbi:MAG: hypothetical protein ACREBN_10555 [Burkholderiaceae bacterium]
MKWLNENAGGLAVIVTIFVLILTGVAAFFALDRRPVSAYPAWIRACQDEGQTMPPRIELLHECANALADRYVIPRPFPISTEVSTLADRINTAPPELRK